jgi:hypothetical protein
MTRCGALRGTLGFLLIGLLSGSVLGFQPARAQEPSTPRRAPTPTGSATSTTTPDLGLMCRDLVFGRDTLITVCLLREVSPAPGMPLCRAVVSDVVTVCVLEGAVYSTGRRSHLCEIRFEPAVCRIPELLATFTPTPTPITLTPTLTFTMTATLTPTATATPTNTATSTPTPSVVVGTPAPIRTPPPP